LEYKITTTASLEKKEEIQGWINEKEVKIQLIIRTNTQLIKKIILYHKILIILKEINNIGIKFIMTSKTLPVNIYPHEFLGTITNGTELM